ncbi:MAG TPA: CDP-alcohol phosphatidyltransferase family protein [Myxococcales bacterium]|jgi:cardiolipin synthase
MNVPNFLTGLRFAAVPVFAVLFVRGQIGAALAVFVFAMVTDWLDGIAARALKQFTKIGAALDPVADKVMGATALYLLCWSHRLPWWLLGVLLFREVCIFSALGILTRTRRSYVVRPTRFGKYSTAFLAATTFVTLIQDARAVRLSPVEIALALVSAECIVLSWAQYLAMFIDLMRKPPVPPTAQTA